MTSKYNAYRLLNRFGFKKVFIVTQPSSGRETFVFSPDYGIPSIILSGNWLRFYDKPLAEIDKGGRPFLILSLTDNYNAKSIEGFARKINENLWFNKTSMVKINIESVHEITMYISALFFKNEYVQYPLMTIEGKGFNPMYFLDEEYHAFNEYLESRGFDVSCIPYGINSKIPDFN